MDFVSNNKKKRSLDSGGFAASRKVRVGSDGFGNAYQQTGKLKRLDNSSSHSINLVRSVNPSSFHPQQKKVNGLNDIGSSIRQQRVSEGLMRRKNEILKDNQNPAKQEENQKNKKLVDILDKVVMASIFILFAGLPLFFLNLTYQGINFEKQYYFYLWTFVCLIAWGVKSIIIGSLTIRRTPLDWVLLTFLFICGVSTLFSIDRYHSFFGFFSNPVQGFVSILIMILAYYLIIMNVNYSRAKVLFAAIIGVGSLISIWVFFGTLGVIPIDIFNKVPLNLVGVSFSSLATYLGMLIAILLAGLALLNESEHDSHGSSVKLIMSVVLFLILAVTIFNISTLFSYVRWISLLISISVLLVFVMGRVIIFSQNIIYVSVGTFLLLVALLIVGDSIFQSDVLPTEASVNYKLAWEVARDSIKEKPLLGSGIGTYGYNFSLFANQSINIRFYSGRGLLLESLTTMGILGFVAFIAVVLMYIGSFVHMLNKYGNRSKIMSLGLFVGVITIMSSAIFWDLDGGILVFGVLLLALSVRVVQGESSSEVATKTFSLKTSPQYALMHSFLFLVVVIGVIFGCVTFGKMFIDDLNAGKAVRAQEEGNFTEGLRYLLKTNDLNHKEGRYYIIGAQYSLILANISIMENDGQVVYHINNAVDQAVLGVNMMPNDVFANEVAGFVYESGWKYLSSDALDQARKFYKKASDLEPGNPSLYISLGKIDLIEMQSIKAVDEESIARKKELAENAKKLFETAENKFSLKDQYAPVYYYLATTNEFLGDIDKAIENMDKAVRLSKKGLNTNKKETYDKAMSQQINYGFNLARLLQIRGADKDNVNAQVDNERAESLFRQILGVNDDELGALLSLGALYESTKRWDDAVEQYNKVIEVLPKDSQARKSVQKLIDDLNIKRGNSSSQNESEGSSGNGGPSVSAVNE